MNLQKLITLTIATSMAGIAAASAASSSLAISSMTAQVQVAPAKVAPGKIQTEDPRITLTKERYDFPNWSAPGASFNGVQLPGLQLPGLIPAGIEFSKGLPTQQFFADANSKVEGKIKRTVCLTWKIAQTPEQARLELLSNLTAVNSPKLLPSNRSAGIEAGEAGYIGYSRDQRISWISFVRGNVAVRINCLDPRANPHPDMAKLAEAVDQWIQSQPMLKDGAPLKRPVVSRFEAARSSCAAGEWLKLNLQVDDAIAHSWELRGSAQGYVEQNEDGIWMLRTTGPGTLSLHCDLMSSTGIEGKTAVITIQVADDD